MEGEKKCSKCAETKELSAFAKQTASKDGLYHICKTCAAIYMRAYRAKNKEKIGAYMKTYQVGHKEERAAKSRIYYEEHKEGCTARGKIWHEEHAEEIAAKKKVYYEEHQEERATYNKIYYEEHKEKLATYSKIYNEEHQEEIAAHSKIYYEEHQEERATYSKIYAEEHKEEIVAYRKEHKAEYNARNAKRHAKKLHATPSWANKDKILEFYKEAQHLSKETGIRHEVDHIYPLQGKTCSGLHVENNLQVITKANNCSKSNKMPEEFYKHIPGN